jgi:hypothetical protein
MKITKSQLKRIIKEVLMGVTYGPEGDEGTMKALASRYFDKDPLDPDKAAELEAVFAGDEDLTDEEQERWDDMQRAEDLEKMYADGRDPGWFEQMGFWPAGGLEENNTRITKSRLKHIIKEETESTLNELYRQWARQEERVNLSDHFGPEEVMEKAIELAADEAVASGYSEWPDPEDFMDQAKEELMRLGG